MSTEAAAAARAPAVAKVRVDRKLTCKVLEAKSLTPASSSNKSPVDALDCYTVLRLDQQEERTATSHGSSNPFWGEEFLFDEIPLDFHQLSVSVWRNRSSEPGKGDEPLGQVVFPKTLLSSGELKDEQWFAMSPYDAHTSVSGDVRVKCTHEVASGENRQHRFIVTVLSARNLVARNANGSSNPYAVLHLLPDPKLETTSVSRTYKATLDPLMNETFIFNTKDLSREAEVHVAFWNAAEQGEDTFMGHLSVPIGQQTKASIDRWFALMPRPAHTVSNGKESRKLTALSKAKQFANALQSTACMHILVRSEWTCIPCFDVQCIAVSKNKQAHKLVDTKLYSLSFCSHCSGIAWALSSQKQCKNCKVTCHMKCAKLLADNCGGVGMIRLLINYKSLRILPVDKYDRLLTAFAKNKYALCTLLGKVSQEREEAARMLIHIHEAKETIFEFLRSILSNEILVAPDVQTLFRANSMASKAIDVYMKHVGLPYLKNTLGPILKKIISSGKGCEVDPTRLDENSNPDENWKNLVEFIQEIVATIFASRDTFPHELRFIFADIQSYVRRKFPDDELAPYTSISGFIFLRFFAPAIMGPKLFGLYDEIPDGTTSRTLTLLAKTLQNLANFVDFGSKEPHMIKMNAFLAAHKDAMKSYIQDISTPLSKFVPSIVSDKSYEKSAALLYEIAMRSTQKLLDSCTESEKIPVTELMTAMEGITLVLEATDDDQINMDTSTTGAKAVVDLLQKRKRGLTGMNGAASSTNGLEGLQISQPAKISESGLKLEQMSPLAARAYHGPTSNPNRITLGASPRSPSKVTTGGPTNLQTPMRKFHQRTLSTDTLGEDDSGDVRNVASTGDIFDQITKMTDEIAHQPQQSDFVELTSTEPTPALSIQAVDKEAADMLESAFDSLSAAEPKNTAVGKCAFCRAAIRKQADALNINGALYHKQHLQCNICKIDLKDKVDKLIYRDQKFFCEEHAKEPEKPKGPVCATCEEVVTKGRVIELLNKTWHPECFVCTACKVPLKTSFVPYNDYPYCREDFMKQSGLICGKCGEFIEADCIEIMDRKYHVECLHCGRCGKSIAGKQYFVLGEETICADHKEELTTCYSCKEHIQGKVVTALAKRRQFHPDHFNCVKCGVNLCDIPFSEREDAPYCQTCWFQSTLLELKDLIK